MLEKKYFFLYIFCQKPLKKKKEIYDDYSSSQKEQQKLPDLKLFWFLQKRWNWSVKMRKIYQSNDDVTHYLSNEKRNTQPLLLSQKLRAILYQTVYHQPEKKKEGKIREKEEEKIIFDA